MLKVNQLVNIRRHPLLEVHKLVNSNIRRVVSLHCTRAAMEEPVFYLKDTHKARALQMFDLSLVVICSHFGLNQSTDEQLEVDPLVVEL